MSKIFFDKEFSRSEGYDGKPASLEHFNNLLDELDSRIKFIPVSDIKVFSPSRLGEGDEIDAESYSIVFHNRADEKKQMLLLGIEDVLALENGDKLIDILLQDKDSFFLFKGEDFDVESDIAGSLHRSGFFCTEEAIIGAAKLCKLSGDAVTKPSKYRDDYVAELIKLRCAENARKREPLPGFTAICIEDAGLKRVLQFRSGRYKSIPQKKLTETLIDLLLADDYGDAECRKWYVDHNISMADLEFPDVLEQLKASYPELPEFPVVPGIRISTGSTGLNTLKMSMTYRRPNASEPVVLSSVSQKHCDTYDEAEFLTACHREIWGRYGELPRRLIELQKSSVAHKDIKNVVLNALKALKFNKIFMCKSFDGPAKGYADMVVSAVKSICDGRTSSLTDVAIAMMDVCDKIKLPESYQEAVRTLLMKAAFVL